MADMQFSIETLETVNYGDHGDRLRKSHAVVPGETVEDLMRRVLPVLTSRYMTHNPTDEVVLRVIVGADGKPTGDEFSGEVPF